MTAAHARRPRPNANAQRVPALRLVVALAAPIAACSPPPRFADVGATDASASDAHSDGARACRPLEMQCDPQGRPAVCNAEGTALVPSTPCQADQRCQAGVCRSPCAEAARSRSYIGCEYWATSTVNSELGAVRENEMSATSTLGVAGFPYALVVSNPYDEPVTVHVTGPDTLIDAEVAPRAVRVVELPWIDAVAQVTRAGYAHRPGRSAFAAQGAYHVTSTLPVVVHQFNALSYRDLRRPECGTATTDERCFSYTNDASLLLPAATLGRRYVVGAWSSWGMRSPFSSDVLSSGGFVTIVGTSSEPTTVRVTLRASIEPGEGVAAAAAGETLTRTLRAGEAWELVSTRPTRETCRTSGTTDLVCRAPLSDLTGSIIEADHAVAVFAGADCANVPTDRGTCDHIEEQLPPIEELGRSYAVARTQPLARQPEPNIVRLVSAADGNVVRFVPESAHAPVTLGRGEFVDVVQNADFLVNASSPLLVTQFTVGQQYWGSGASQGGLGDPGMTIAPPIEQWRADYAFLSPETFTRNFANVVAPHGATVVLDGEALRATPSTLGEYDVYRVELVGRQGVHRIATTDGRPFGLTVYGFGSYSSYMYPGGLDLEQITPG